MAFRITLEGITADDIDQTVDSVKNVNCKVLEWFGVIEGFDFKILRRGSPPLGGGCISFVCPVITSLKPINKTDFGLIKRIRGIAATTRVSPQIANRLIEAVRSVLNRFTPDIYIYSDVFKGNDAGKSPGYSLFLLAETTTGSILSADGRGLAEQTVEDVALGIAHRLLKQIRLGGIVGQSHQWMLLTLIALCPEDLSKIVLGPLAPSSSTIIEDIKIFLGVSFKITPSGANSTSTLVSCVGSGYVNLNRRTQ